MHEKFPEGPVVRTHEFHCGGLGSFPGWELRSHKPRGMAKKRKKKKKLQWDWMIAKTDKNKQTKAPDSFVLNLLNC